MQDQLKSAILDGIRSHRYSCLYSAAWHECWDGRYVRGNPRFGRLLPQGGVRTVAKALADLILSGVLTAEQVAASFDAACKRKGCPDDTAADMAKLAPYLAKRAA